MKLETPRLLLRPWEESDAPALYLLAYDPDVGPRCGWRPHGSVRESEDTIRHTLAKPEICAVTMKPGGCLIGSIGLHPMEEQPEDRRELGYWIGKPYWGCGYAPEAAREMLRCGFEELGCSEIWCGHFDFNMQSKRVIEKCGFRYRKTQETTLSDGVPHVTLMYAIRRAEWEAER